MKFNVVGTYKHEMVVDTDSEGYKRWRESWRGRSYVFESYAVEMYALNMFNSDDKGVRIPDNLDWTVKTVKEVNS